MQTITEYVFDKTISSIDEYVSHSETISLIKEYLLSKKNKVISEKHFILWPSYDIYEKLMEQYEKEMIRIGLDYWILSEAETLDVLEGFSVGYIKEHLRMFAVPDNYDVATLRNELIERKKHPSDFHEIDPYDIICKP